MIKEFFKYEMQEEIVLYKASGKMKFGKKDIDHYNNKALQDQREAKKQRIKKWQQQKK